MRKSLVCLYGGSPVISPLLANIALDGMARFIETLFPKKRSRNQAVLIRYADDFVVISPSLEIIEQCQTAISEWLKPIGLELKPEKTRVCHTLNPIKYNGKTGSSLLGMVR
jgi:RNA-directed DNA polymerase